MFSHMREYKTFVKDTKTGVERARTDQYAYITEYPYLEYYNQQKPCNTRLLKNLIQTKSYGIGLQRNSPYTNRITVAILKVSIIGGKQWSPLSKPAKEFSIIFVQWGKQKKCRYHKACYICLVFKSFTWWAHPITLSIRSQLCDDFRKFLLAAHMLSFLTHFPKCEIMFSKRPSSKFKRPRTYEKIQYLIFSLLKNVIKFLLIVVSFGQL